MYNFVIQQTTKLITGLTLTVCEIVLLSAYIDQLAFKSPCLIQQSLEIEMNEGKKRVIYRKRLSNVSESGLLLLLLLPLDNKIA